MSSKYDAESPWRLSKNGTSYFRYWDTLTDEEIIKFRLRPENDFKTTVDDFSYVVKVYDNGNTVVFRNPISAGTPNRRSNSDLQSHGVLSAEHVKWLRQAASNSEVLVRIEGSLARIEAVLKQFRPEKE